MCLEVSKSVNRETNGKQVEHKMEETPNDGFRIRRVAGGSIVSHPPLFSADGNLLFVINEKAILAFSANTGEFVRNYENTVTAGQLIGMCVDQGESKYIYGCTSDALILCWKIGSGVLHEKYEVQLSSEFCVESFHIVYDGYGGFTFLLHGRLDRTVVAQYCPRRRRVLELISLTIQEKQDLPDNTYSANNEQYLKVLVAAGGVGLNYFAYVGEYHWNWVVLKSKPILKTRPHVGRVKPVLVACHPTEPIVAVGDMLGRVTLYRDFLFTRSPVYDQYHWHPHAVQCLAFTGSGTHFYSGGSERVLVKWKIGQHEKADLVPRVSDSIAHVAVGPENLKIALCTSDNSIRVLNAFHKPIATVQSFSKISNDVPGAALFPIGLRTNPRTQAIILNGRVGCIQFFSTYTNSLLYTLDITLRNYNTNEDRSTIHNTVVTNVAVNVHWLATVEHWTDYHNSTETRLKFWKYDESRQIYSLNTSVENVHLGGVCGLEFSNHGRERDVQCASAGLGDNRIKLWSVEEVQQTGGSDKPVWTCTGLVQYRNLPVRSISFSQDCSLLAAGFGNVLCAWNTDTLKLKCALSAPNGFDGCVNRVVVTVPERKTTPKKQSSNRYEEARRKIIAEMIELMQGKTDSALVRNATDKRRKTPSSRLLSARREVEDGAREGITETQKSIIFQKIQATSLLNIFKKASLFSSFGIGCKTSSGMKRRIDAKLLASSRTSRKAERDLYVLINGLSTGSKYRALQKVHNVERFQCSFRSCGLRHVFVINPKEVRTPVSQREETSNATGQGTAVPVKTAAQIRNVLFCNGPYSHLVVVSTENRLMVWNLLSLKLQVSVALSIEQIALDPFTNLIATFTDNNELYVFLPNIPMPLYHRERLPKVYGAVWIPRRYPRSQSLNVDWQATSQLFFLNEKQELLHLVSDHDEESLGPVMCMNEAVLGPNTPFAAMLAKQSTGSNVQTNVRSGLSIGIPGKSAVKEIVSSSSHTMAPVSLLCKDFLRSLIVSEEKSGKDSGGVHSERSMLNGGAGDGRNRKQSESDSGSSDKDDTEEVQGDDDNQAAGRQRNRALLNEKIQSRKAALAVVNRAKKTYAATSSAGGKVSAKLRELFDEPIDLCF
ncbi:WD repeat-containing protein 75 [Anopheles aquasalis]|uniref:WD repeat-containing protein 75 n=1 Tax=Anopheles aquasalis TaxID=42839 RepID=UPI00215B4DCD|nr:WD repeat-containing protein 75 [Anopheles aquasalis]